MGWMFRSKLCWCRMNKQDSVDEVFGLNTPKELDTVKIGRYFKDLERAVRDATIAVKYSDDDGAREAVDGISNELSWVEDDVYNLLQFYEDAQDLLATYRSIVEKRMTEDETYEHNTILVRNKMEAVK